MIDFQAAAGGNIDGFVESCVHDRCTSDRYDNDVTLIELPDYSLDGPLRMVHHNDPRSPLQKSTIYCGRDFVRYSAYSDESRSAAARWIKIGGYEAEWVDGQLIRLQQHPTGPLIRHESVAAINGSFAAFLLLALSAVIEGDLWQCKGGHYASRSRRTSAPVNPKRSVPQSLASIRRAKRAARADDSFASLVQHLKG